MAAFFSSHILTPRVAPRGAPAIAAPRVNQRRSIHPAPTAARVEGTAAEILLFLWTLLVLAFSLLVTAGFIA